jgi:hypothetical protein
VEAIAWRIDGYGRGGLPCHACACVGDLPSAMSWFGFMQEIGYERVALTPIIEMRGKGWRKKNYRSS